MTSDWPLPGLDRLIEVCRRYTLPLRLPPPLDAAPRAAVPFLGQAFDPVLAAVYQRTGSATLGDFFIENPDPNARDNIFQWNEEWRLHGEEPLRSCIVFGMVPNLAFYFATVPRLADAQGLQPVLYIDNYDEKFIVPVASSVDRFFDAYSRYLEQVVQSPDYDPRHFSAVHFPLTVPALIARDRPLVERVRAGHFDSLMTTDEQTREWVQTLLAA